MSDLRLSRTAAINLIRTAADLFRDGTGLPLDPEQEPSDLGLIDDIPMDEDAYYWANELLRFARVVHGILSNALHNQPEDLGDTVNIIPDIGD